MSDSKTLRKTVKPLFTDKRVNRVRILLVEGNETIPDDNKISEKLNNFPTGILKTLNISQNGEHLFNTDNIDDSILRAKENLKTIRVFS